MLVTSELLTSYPEWAKIRSQVDPCVIEKWEKDFFEIIVVSVKITDTTVTINSSINVELESDREGAEKFVLYLLGKPKTK